jgi:Xaa-Pro aminopeptidase
LTTPERVAPQPALFEAAFLLLTELQKAGFEFEVDLQDNLLPQRKVKTEDELKRLRNANRASAAGFRLVENALAASKISKGVLVHQGKVLTSEKLRQQISHGGLMSRRAAKPAFTSLTAASSSTSWISRSSKAASPTPRSMVRMLRSVTSSSAKATCWCLMPRSCSRISGEEMGDGG